jgi:hypothetical protein
LTAATPSDGSKRFDLTAAPSILLDQKRIRDATIMQCFAFDDRNSVLYVAQVMQGGRQLTGESAPVSGADRAAHGDVCISRVSYAGVLLSSMYLRRFGQPVAIGVEPVGSDSYLWLGTASGPVLLDHKGFPTRVGRVQFVPGSVVDYPSTEVEVHNPVTGATEVSASFDALNRTLLVRYRVSGIFKYDLYAVDAFRAKSYRPLYHRTETGISDVYQGHAHYFDQVYRLEGRSGGVTAAPTYVSSFDLTTGRMAQRSRNDAAPALTFREPEGLAVQRMPGTAPRLHVGFADGAVGARNMSLYYTDRYGN